MHPFTGQLAAIFLAPERGAPMQPMALAEALAGSGLRDDRYGPEAAAASKSPANQPKRQVTLIEQEAVEAACREYDLEFTPAVTRRNLVTRGVPLNHLVGQTFRVGSVLLRGVELCEPCGHLETLTLPGIRKALVHRGGLRAELLTSGTLRVGDAIVPAAIPGGSPPRADVS